MNKEKTKTNRLKFEVLTDNSNAGREVLADIMQERICLFLNVTRPKDYNIKSRYNHTKQGTNTNLTMEVDIEYEVADV